MSDAAAKPGLPKTPTPKRAGGAVVRSLAYPFERLIELFLSGSFGEKLFDLICDSAGFVDRWVGRGLVFVGRIASRVAGYLPWPGRLSLMLAILLGIVVVLSRITEEWVQARLDLTPKQLVILDTTGLISSFHIATKAFGLAALLIAPAPILVFVRLRAVYYYLLGVAVVFVALWFVPLAFVIDVPGRLFDTAGSGFDKSSRNFCWIFGVAAWLPVAGVGALLALCVLTRRTKEHFFRTSQTTSALGDRLYASFTSHGVDPTYRTSLYWSGAIHFVLLVVYPLIHMMGGEKMLAYGVPKGRGMPTIQGVAVRAQPKRVRQKQNTKRIKFVLNMNSAIIFSRPDIDDSRVGAELEQVTTDTYVATSFASDGSSGRGTGAGGGSSGLGAGGPGRGGWPNGMENAKIRFIRLQYDGGDWAQEMGLGCDHNMLLMFSKYTGFKVADKTESIPITALKRFPAKRAPPFVYITGNGGVNASAEEVKVLRWYLLQEVGMIFADNGGGNFNSSFRGLMKRIVPELEWVDIANDDVVFQQPFVFPNGAPPLWHYSGMRAQGLKYNGRWVVFYHQGDLKDAWKTGHSGVSEAHASQAYQLGVNVLNYAFNQYMTAQFGQ
ncbi:MAG TPA: DUF4159 domain-containing protein [Planctomycetota bacterium]|jgi:hypothetical protein